MAAIAFVTASAVSTSEGICSICSSTSPKPGRLMTIQKPEAPALSRFASLTLPVSVPTGFVGTPHRDQSRRRPF